MGHAVATNPFSTARTRPGAIEYQFPAGESAEALLARLHCLHWRGAIVGPHGSGKSTLLATLRPWWDRLGRQAVEITLHDGQRRLASSFWRQHHFDAATQIVLDGYEQLSPLERWRLNWLCRRRGCGLLVTSHQSVGLPLVYHTSVNLETVATIVARLTKHTDWHVSSPTLGRLMRRCHGDVREMLFNLYDLYESQRKHPG